MFARRPIGPAIDPQSDAYIQWLAQEAATLVAKKRAPRVAIGADAGVPFYDVPIDQPRVPVTLTEAARLQAVIDDVLHGLPIPAEAVASRSTDRTMLVYQRGGAPDGKDLYIELWKVNRAPGSSALTAKLGGISLHYGDADDDGTWSREHDLPDTNVLYLGVSASGQKIAPLIIRPDDIEAGKIDHALRLSLPRVAKGFYDANGACRSTDGALPFPALPYGACLWLPPTAPPADAPIGLKLIMEAASTYGLYVGETTHFSIAIGAQNLNDDGAKMQSLMGGTGGDVLAQFPWDKLKLVQMQPCRGGKPIPAPTA